MKFKTAQARWTVGWRPAFISNITGLAYVAGLLLTGCCTSRHAQQWEYKVVAGNGNANAVSSAETQQALLNEQGKQGWIFIQNEGGWFYFKRAKQ